MIAPFLLRIRYGWNAIRIVRLVLGIVIAGSGVQAYSPVVIVFGALLAVQGLLGFGTCVGGACTVHADRMHPSTTNQQP
ncbi:MAG: hypothetical protein OHK0039_17450 [Bacteroidia bacterium]